MTPDPARTLLRASCALRRRDISWGRDWFRNPADDSRCALGAIAWATGDDISDGNPFWSEPGKVAAREFARWLVMYRDAVECTTDDGDLDVMETVAGVNDDPVMDADQMARLLSQCARYLDERESCVARHPAGKAVRA